MQDDFIDKVGQYIFKYAIETYLSIEELYSLQHWWATYQKMIANEVFELSEQAQDAGRKDELNSLKDLIEAEGNIDNDSPNTKRIIHLIDTMIDELDQEVDYSEDNDL